MVLRFSTVDNDQDAGKVIIHFTKPPRFEIEHCTTSQTDFLYQYSYLSTNLIWTITQIRKPNEFRLLVHKSSDKMADFLLSDETCEADNWKTYWSRSVANMNFKADDDASDMYRQGEHTLHIIFWKKKHYPFLLML